MTERCKKSSNIFGVNPAGRMGIFLRKSACLDFTMEFQPWAIFVLPNLLILNFNISQICPGIRKYIKLR
jgi:hypothetical protein